MAILPVAIFNELLYNSVMDKLQNIHKYIWIELLVWICILVLIIAGIKIHSYKNTKNYDSYRIFLPDVDGLIVGSPVRYMGVPVGNIEHIKIISDEVYIRFIITDKDLVLPKGVIATVEFNGLGGSKSLEIYPPTKESIASGKLVYVSDPVRLNDVFSLFNHMFDKIDSMASRMSFFARETGMDDMDNTGLNFDEMERNVIVIDKVMKHFKKGDERGENIE